MKPIRILLADDHALVRAGFRALLQDLGMEVVGEAGNGREAIRLIETCKPEVVLMELAMPELNGLEATARIAQEYPQVRVILVSMHSSAEYVRRALRAGAAGYLLKEANPNEFELAITSVARGDSYLSPAVAKFVVADYTKGATPDEESPDGLTVRHREVLQLMVEGHARQEVANKLHISVKTFDTYRAQIMERLDVHDLAGLVRYAVRTGLIRIE